MTLKIHCSDLPRIMSCSASAVPPQMRFVGEPDITARNGTAAHACYAEMLQGREPDIAAIAARENADPDETRLLFYLGRKLYDRYEPAFKILAVETAMMHAEAATGVDLVGTGDIIAEAISEPVPTLAVVDWKTGYVDRDYTDQCMGYADMAIREWPETERIKGIIFWVRDQSAEVVDVTLDDLKTWRERLCKTLGEPESYCPAPLNCEFCPRGHECTARLALVQRTVFELSDVQDKIGALAPAALGQMYPKVTLLKRALDAYDGALKAALANGPIATGDGREIFLDARTRKTLDAHLTIDELARRRINGWGALKVTQKDLKKLIGNAAAKGMKGKDIAAVYGALAEAGAISVTPYTALDVRRIQQALPEGGNDGAETD